MFTRFVLPCIYLPGNPERYPRRSPDSYSATLRRAANFALNFCTFGATT
jgi:hypothetical protein